MSTPKRPDPAKLIIGCILNDKAMIEPVCERLELAFGGLDLVSPWFDFDFTHYYETEMGAGLFRKVFVFKDLIPQADLARIKLETNAMEQDFTFGGNRRVNLDPGYLLASRLVLATGKEYSHRIYIGQGIYADLTLMYSKGKGFTTLDWTYPDYASESMTLFLEKARDKYLLDLKRHVPDKDKGKKE